MGIKTYIFTVLKVLCASDTARAEHVLRLADIMFRIARSVHVVSTLHYV